MPKETQIVSCRASTSISSLIGNMTGFLRFFLNSKFPEGFFKDTYIEGSLAEIKMEENESVHKLSKPTLIMAANYTGSTGHMDLLPRWHNSQYFIFKNPRKKYNPVLYDNVNDIYMYSIPDRIRIDYNIRIVLPTQMYAYNILHYVKQNFDIGGKFFYNDVRLETEIPKYYTKIIEQRLGLDLSTGEGQETLEDYLLRNSYNGITEKVNLSTGNKAYPYNHGTNMLIEFPELPTIESDDNQQIREKAVVTFPVSIECWSHSNYILELKGKIPDVPPEFPDAEGTVRYDFYVPTEFIKEQYDNMHLLKYKPFVPDVNTEVDILDFSPVVQSEVKNVIREMIINKIDIDKVLKVKVLIDNKELLESSFEVDWKEMTLATKDPMMNVTYTLMLYGNLKSLNLVNQWIIDGKRTDIPNLD
jgi:hypothetical protein